MKIFLDTANLQSIKQWAESGLIDGVTTNPTHLSKEGGDAKKLVQEICALIKDKDVSVEVTEVKPDAVYNQAKRIAALANNVVVKIPCHKDYFLIIKRLIDEGIALNVTLVFTLLQSLFMCKLGVKYISPFIGRWDDIDVDGVGIVAQIRDMMDEYQFDQTQIIAASIRGVRQFHDAILAGAHVVTLPAVVLEKAVEHPLTDRGMATFLADWQKLGIKQFP